MGREKGHAVEAVDNSIESGENPVGVIPRTFGENKVHGDPDRWNVDQTGVVVRATGESRTSVRTVDPSIPPPVPSGAALDLTSHAEENELDQLIDSLPCSDRPESSSLIDELLGVEPTPPYGSDT